MLNKELADALNQAIKQGTVILSSYEVALHDGYGYGLVLMKGNTELCQYLSRVIGHLQRNGWLHNLSLIHI